MEKSASSPIINLPGLRQLREAVANRSWRGLPKKLSFRRNAIAGLIVAISEFPDAMANSLLVGVNPMYGLYANMVGPIVGGLFSSTQLMMMVTTSAASLTAGQAIAAFPSGQRLDILFLVAILSGIFQILLGLLGAGRLIRFVSYSVMTGLLTGVGALLVLSQLPTAAGYSTVGSKTVTRALELLTHISEIHLPSLSLAALTLALAIILPRTRLGHIGVFFAVIIPSALVVALHIEGVKLVRHVGEISITVPTPSLPSFSYLIQAVTGALAVTAVVLVQGAGVSQSVPNPDGSRRRTSRDFIAQGAANLASGLFRGLPIGGSLSATTLNVASGANKRWAAVFTGIWMFVIVEAFSRWVSYVAMPALAGLLIHVGIQSLLHSEFRSIWRVGWPSRIACLTTFFSTLLFPIEIAVGLGAALSALLYTIKSASDISVVELVRRLDGKIEEHVPPGALRSNDVTVLDVYGHLFYAGARTLEAMLPDPCKARNPMVIIRLRGRTVIGATLIDVLFDYADKLGSLGGRLFLSGVTEQAKKQLVASGKFKLRGPAQIFDMTPVVGESTSLAYEQAQAWLISLDKTGGESDLKQAKP